MKINRVRANNHKRAFEIETDKGSYTFPYAELDVSPTTDNPIRNLYVDEELDREAFTVALKSGDEDTVHLDHVLEHHRDPDYERELLLYRLTLEAQRRIAESPLSKRELIRRLKTSPAQFYRLLDQTNTRKSLGQMIDLLTVLGCHVDIIVRDGTTAKSA